MTTENVRRQVLHYLGMNEFDPEVLEPVLCFVVLWNQLEARHDTELGLFLLRKSILQISRQLAPGFPEYDEQIRYFRDRYEADDEPYSSLIRQSPRELESQFIRKLRRLLDGENLTGCDKLEAVMSIPYRIRNNLFHGRKGTEELHRQIELFEHTNLIVSQFIEHFDRVGVTHE